MNEEEKKLPDASQLDNQLGTQASEQPQTIEANMLQIAVLNKMLPKGYKFDLVENLYKHQLASQ